MGLHVLRSPESENHILSLDLHVCVSLCAHYQHNTKTNYNRNIAFSIIHLYHVQMLLEIFHKDRTKTLCTGAQKKFLYITAYRRFFMLVSFRILRLHQIQ